VLEAGRAVQRSDWSKGRLTSVPDMHTNTVFRPIHPPSSIPSGAVHSRLVLVLRRYPAENTSWFLIGRNVEKWACLSPVGVVRSRSVRRTRALSLLWTLAPNLLAMRSSRPVVFLSCTSPTPAFRRLFRAADRHAAVVGTAGWPSKSK
jgi:hypothetical protein